MGEQWKQWQTLFPWAPKSLQMVTAAMKLKDAYSLEGKLWPTQTAYWKAETLLCQQSPSSQGYGFSSSMYGCESWTIKKAERRRIDAFELWVLEKTLESPLDCKEIQPVHPKGDPKGVLGVHWKDWCWSWNSNTLATWHEELTHLKRPWCWERLKAGGEVDNRGWDDWMASTTQWTWIWVDSGSWWWTERPSVLWFMGSQSLTWLSDWIDWFSYYLHGICFSTLLLSTYFFLCS